jgi:hypothetical protein
MNVLVYKKTRISSMMALAISHVAIEVDRNTATIIKNLFFHEDVGTTISSTSIPKYLRQHQNKIKAWYI